MPADVPNHFAINILPDQVEEFGQFMKEAGVVTAQLYPMVRGRLVKINNTAVQKAVTKEERSDNALNRELNLTWTTRLQEDNRILSGRWWRPRDTGKPRVSVESQLAERLEIELGDELGFSIGGQTISARVTSIRYVKWDSFRPNF